VTSHTTAPVPQPARRSYDRLQVARLASGRWSFAGPSDTDAATWPFLVVYSFNGGATVRQGDDLTTTSEGDLLVLRNSTALQVTAHEGADVLVIRVPDDTVGPYRQSMTAAHGTAIPTRTGTASLVAHLLEGLAAQPDDYAPENPGRLAQHIVGLVALMCIDCGAGDAGRPSLLQKAKDYIEVHLGDLDLAPDSVAWALNVSTRTLHRLFESEGLTISGWIRSRRLENCRVELGDNDYRALSVSGIGARWGLWDAAHFSRLFKSTYGLSPRAFREAALRRERVLETA